MTTDRGAHWTQIFGGNMPNTIGIGCQNVTVNADTGEMYLSTHERRVLLGQQVEFHAVAAGALLCECLQRGDQSVPDEPGMGLHVGQRHCWMGDSLPYSPSNLTLAGVSGHQLALNWTAVGGATGYEVQYTTGAINWTGVVTWTTYASLPADSSSTNIDGLASGSSYDFRVVPLNGTTPIGYSNLVTGLIPDTRTWDGGGGADDNWMTAANWVGDVAPVAGDRLVFAGTTPTSAYNNFPSGTIFDGITFASGYFTLLGNSVKLNPQNGIAFDNVAGQNQIDLPISAGSTGTTIVEAGTLELGVIAQLGLNAQAMVLYYGGADIQGGSLIFDYSGGSSLSATILAKLTASYDGGAWDIGQFRTDPTGGITLGWKDDGVSKVTVMATYAGDANLDGSVNGLDLDIWKANFGIASGATFSMADLNYDGTVNGLDLDLWKATFGLVVEGSPSGDIVPEVSSPQVSLSGKTDSVASVGESPATSSQEGLQVHG